MAYHTGTRAYILFFVLFAGWFSAQGIPTQVTLGNAEYRTLLFPDTSLNNSIMRTPAAKNQFPLVVEYAIPAQRLFQLYSFKQDPVADTTKLLGADIHTYADYVYGGMCGRHAPKNAAYGLAALDDYQQLAQNPSLAAARRQQIIDQFIAYAHSITFLTPASLQALQKINERIICYRTAQASSINIRSEDGRILSSTEYIATKATYTDESKLIAREIKTLTGLPFITPSDISYTATPQIARATSSSSMTSLPDDLIKEVAKFRSQLTYHHAFTVSMNLSELQNTTTTNHVITIIVYKTPRQTAFILIDSGFVLSTMDYRGGKQKLVLSSSNLLHSAAAQTFVSLFTITPLPPEYATAAPTTADEYITLYQKAVSAYNWSEVQALLIAIKGVAEEAQRRNNGPVLEQLLQKNFTLKEINERIESARKQEVYVPYIPVLAPQDTPTAPSYQNWINRYRQLYTANPKEALTLLNKIDRLQQKDALRGRSYVPIFVTKMGLTPAVIIQQRQDLQRRGG